MTVRDDRLRDVIAEQAAAWHVRHREGEVTGATQVEFMDWLRASPMHVREYLELARLTNSLPHAMAAMTPEVPSNVLKLSDFHLQPARADSELGSRPVLKRIAAVAAAAAIACVATCLYAWQTGYLGVIGVLPIDASTSQLTVMLRDGSQVHLNAGARVHVHFSRAERLLELEVGQAQFDVAHDRSRPFRVQAGSADVIAVGTRFDVNRHASALTVTVVEGKVDVVDKVAETAAVGHTAPPAVSVRVVAGQRIEVGSDGEASAAQPVDARTATAWMRHDIAFASKPLADVADELNRYLDKPIVIQDAGLRALRVSGVFNAYDSESFLAFLRQYDVEIDARDNVIYVRARVTRPVAPSGEVTAHLGP
jgi:transmembrane sensor